jgi:aryl-alcohol dehydrogenase-like predicted oxidoreductase
MEHVRLGSTGLQVSRICLGTMTFAAQANEASARAILDRAADAGVTFLDTSNSYPSYEQVGQAEEIIGGWLKGRRDAVVVATKCFGPTGPDPLPFQGGLSRKAIFDALDGSLRRLQTDYVDLYQLHHPDPGTPIEESLEALDDLVAMGKVRYVGCSNYMAYQVAMALGRSDARGLVRYVSVQSRHNLLFREFERELLPLCLEEGLGFIPFSPLAGGMLTGKHVRGTTPDRATRFSFSGTPLGDINRDRYWNDRNFDAVEALGTLAAHAGLELATLAIAWSLSHPAVTAPIVGASRPEQLDAPIAAVDVTLDADLLARIDEVTRHFRWGESNR